MVHELLRNNTHVSTNSFPVKHTYKNIHRFINPNSKRSLHMAAPWLKRLVAGFPYRRPRFEPGSGQVGFVVGKVALGQVFSEYFGFPCQSSFHQILHHHNHPGQVQ
jgi:hypothetical protein